MFFAPPGDLSGKADKVDVDALREQMPRPAQTPPLSERTNGAVGEETQRFALEDHRHKRLTSTTGPKATEPTRHVLPSSGIAEVMFTQAFTDPPAPIFIEVPPLNGAAMPDDPLTFRVQSWMRETMLPTPDGAYVGCVVKAWRGQRVPTIDPVTSLVNVLGVNRIVTAITGFNPFAGPVAGAAFMCVAVARSDTSQ